MITRNDLSKTSGSSPTGATKTSKPAKQSEHPERNQQWFVVDKEGLRKTLSRKGKAFAIYELLQNAYDENSTRLEVTLTEPKNGKSTLICIDDAPNGYGFVLVNGKDLYFLHHSGIKQGAELIAVK